MRLTVRVVGFAANGLERFGDAFDNGDFFATPRLVPDFLTFAELPLTFDFRAIFNLQKEVPAAIADKQIRTAFANGRERLHARTNSQ